MAAQSKRVKAGDVLMVTVGDGVAYLHLLGRHAEYGEAVLVSRRFDAPARAMTAQIFTDAYVTFYPVTAAVTRKLVAVVGHLTPPPLPTRFRRAGGRSGRRVDTWIIESAGKELVKTILSDEELKLPIAAIWNHESLVQRIGEVGIPTRV